MPTRIIGIGNLDRGDDAAGLLVARRLRELQIEAIDFTGEALSLIDLWEGCDTVIVVDAVVTGNHAGKITRWNAAKERVPREAFQCSTRNFGVADAVELARIVDRLPPNLFIHGIEGHHFAPGHEPGKRVLEAVERLAQEVAACVNASHSPGASKA